MIQIWAVFDTETTDLVGHDLLPLKSQPHIIEFAGLRFSMDENGEGEELAALDFICDPQITIGETTTRITGLKQEDLRKYPPFNSHFAEVVEFFAGATHRSGHNLVFDEDMLTFEYRRGEVEDWRPKDHQRRICTCERTEHLFGYRPKLSNLHEYLFGETFEGAHRAMVDVKATVRCIRELRKRDQI